MRLIFRTVVLMAALFSFLSITRDSLAENKNRVLCYTAYDSDYFYFAAVVQKPNLAGTDKQPFGNPIQDDAMAVFLQSEEAPAAAIRSDRSVEMAVGVAGGSQLYRGAAATPLTGFSDFKKTTDGGRAIFKYGVGLHGRLNVPGGDNTSYSVEMAIPWAELGVMPAPGTKMRFNAVALSSAAGSPAILSLSPDVKISADLQNPSKWTEIIFVEAPVKSVASAPGAKVCARVLNAKPLINGEISEGEWNVTTTFGFSAAEDGAVTPVFSGIDSARIRPTVKLNLARPPIKPALEPFNYTGELIGPFPKLVLSRYLYDWQNDPRKSAPLNSARSARGESLLMNHPYDGSGPWMSYDRVDWHRKQLAEMSQSGIDVALPVYKVDDISKSGYARQGLLALVSAIRALDNHEMAHPALGLCLDTSSLSGENLNTGTAAGQQRLYSAIREFFLLTPPYFRAATTVQGRRAAIALLTSASPLGDVNDAAITYCRERFRHDFGIDLLMLGGSDFKGKAKLDGYLDDTRGHGFQAFMEGPIKIAAVGPGFDETVLGEGRVDTSRVRFRDEGAAYKSDWNKAISSGANWVMIDSWNDYRNASQIASSLEYGMEYVDTTRIMTRRFAGIAPFKAKFTEVSIPAVVPVNSILTVSAKVTNQGTTIWVPGQIALYSAWKAEGAQSFEQVTALNSPLLPGQTTAVVLKITAPAKEGPHTLLLDMAQLTKKSVIENLFSKAGAAAQETLINVAPGAELSVGLVSCSLPSSLEAGGTYQAKVTLRNDGRQTWKSGSGRIVGRLWKISMDSSASSFGEPVDMADASMPLTADVASGQLVTITIPITFSQAEQTPLPVLPAGEASMYQLRWEYSENESGTVGAVSAGDPLALIDSDVGLNFAGDFTFNQLPGDRRLPIKLNVRNLGPQSWRKDVSRIGYHWYYLDGSEAVWEDETTGLPRTLDPGASQNDLFVWITAPPNDGTYYLVWDLKLGDTWASTLPGVRAWENMTHLVQVVRGHLTMVDLSTAYNIIGITDSTSANSGDFDGSGRTFAAELTPPYVIGSGAPAALWLPGRATGLASPRRISFKWGSRGEKLKNIIRCEGQKVILVKDVKKAETCIAVHILAAATKEGVTGAFTLLFADGAQQYTSFPFSRWDASPAYNEETSWVSRYSRKPGGLDKPVALFHYTIRIPDKKKPVAIMLPDAPNLRIAAITLEK